MNSEPSKELFAFMQQRKKDEQQKKLQNYQYLNLYAQKHQVLFTGSSLMEQFPISELSISLGLGKAVYNRGIGGYTTDDFLKAIHPMLLDLCPSKVFINIGSNDMREWENGEDWMKHLLANYRTILTIARQELPLTAFYLMAYYPVNETFASLSPYHASMLKIRTNENVRHINRELARLADSFGQTYIDVSQGLTDESGALKKELTIDGIHMYSTAYRMIYQNLLPYICAEE